MADTTRQIVWVDAGGRTRVTLPTANGSLSAVMAALEAQSNAGVLNWFEGVKSYFSPSPASAVYADVADLARLLFTDGTDQMMLALPAPVSSLFLADGVTVDPTQAATIISAAIGTLVTASGVPVTAYLGGTRNLRMSGS